MEKKSKNLLVAFIIMLVISGILFGFSIFTTSSGFYRMYLLSSLPFVYHPHVSTPADYFGPIEAGAESWDHVRSAYWEFQMGNTVSNSAVVQDGVNLVFFDTAGVNFPPPTNTIAFSRTFTTGAGTNFHAVESDLVWNARDYPPNPTNIPGGIDLQGTVAHEFGHHLGLGHVGPVGGPPGVGEIIPEATMYGTATGGDTTARSLHIHDKAGVTTIYPGWILEGTITDLPTGNPIHGPALITCGDTFTVDLGGVEEPATGAYQIPGYLADSYVTDGGGDYSIICLIQDFELSVSRFGYPPQNFQIHFDYPRPTPTQVLDGNIELVPYPSATISGIVFNTATSSPAKDLPVDLFGMNKDFDRFELYKSTTTDSNGNYSFTVPSEEGYKVVVSPEFPYHFQSKKIGSLPAGGAVMDMEIGTADVLVVNDHPQQEYDAYFTDALDSLGVAYHLWTTFDHAITPPPVKSMSSLFNYDVIIWFTGEATTTCLFNFAKGRDSLGVFLDNGGKLFLTGQNVAERLQSNNFLSDYLHVGYGGNSTSILASPVAGNPISVGMSALLINGAETANNQLSMDVLSPLSGGLAAPAFNFLPSGTAVVSIDDTVRGSKIVLSSIGLEGIRYHATQKNLLKNILTWFDPGIIVGISNQVVSEPFSSFRLAQNYPNPFNPKTTIEYTVPQNTKVQIKIFNLLGQQVRELVNGDRSAGIHRVTWDSRNEFGEKVPSGVYFYRMSTETGFQSVKKLLLLK